MGQAASYAEDNSSYDSDEEEASLWSSSQEEEGDGSGYESEGSSVSLNDDGGGRGGRPVPHAPQPRSRFSAAHSGGGGGKPQHGEQRRRLRDGANADEDAAATGDLPTSGAPPSPSRPTEPQAPATVDLESLSVDELKSRIESLRIAREDVLGAARSARRAAGAHGHNASANGFTAENGGAGDAGFYLDDNYSATDVKVAMRVLAASPHVRELRFRLVPARLKECAFWGAVLGMLRGGSGKRSEVGEAAGSDKGGGPSPSRGTPRKSAAGAAATEKDGGVPTRAQASTPISSHSSSKREIEELRQRLRQRDAEVTQLRRSLDGARSKIGALERDLDEAKRAATGPGGKNGSKVPPQPHRGNWVMDRDSADFLALDDELKANLRSEKEKRLREVRDQMKFILDTDDVAGSIGQWDCCGGREYGGKGCA